MKTTQIQQIFNGMVNRFDLTYPQFDINSKINFNNNGYDLIIGGFENVYLTSHFKLQPLAKSNNQQYVALELLHNTLNVLYNFNEQKTKQDLAKNWMQSVSKEQFIQRKDEQTKYINEVVQLNQVYFKNQADDIQKFLTKAGY